MSELTEPDAKPDPPESDCAPLSGSVSAELATFAPGDLTDGRAPYDWETRWPARARKQIFAEALYLIVTIVAAGILVFLSWDGRLGDWLGVPPGRAKSFTSYAIAALGGAIGGATFSLKWLYHSVAHGRWHQDRLIWRVCTPVISGAVAFALIALVRSGVLQLLNAEPLRVSSGALAVGFIAGYFSDNVIASLLRMAEKVFGSSRTSGAASDADEHDDAVG